MARADVRVLAAGILALAALAAPASAAGGEAAALIASEEPGWPQWRGPRRDGISEEKGLLQAWLAGGPRLLWTASGLGAGWSSPIITRGAIYITGDIGPDLCVFALDMDGKLTWRSKNGTAWKGSYQGARACCAYSEGHVYHSNAHGRVACLEAATGREVWAVNVLERFAGQNLTWAVSECLLVDGQRVIVTPGGRKAFVATLDKKSGETAWAGEPLPNSDAEPVGYSSPILFKLGSRRLLAALSVRSVVCVDADTGKIQWTFPKKTRYDANCATPVLCGDSIFHTNPSGSGCVLLRLIPGEGRAGFEKTWEGRMDNISGGAIARDGCIYGSGHLNTGWVCIDAQTGQERWQSQELAQGSLIYADGRMYWLSEQGVMALVKASPQAFEVAGRFEFARGRRDVWAHPVLLDGRLYLRYHDKLYCYDVRQPR